MERGWSTLTVRGYAIARCGEVMRPASGVFRGVAIGVAITATVAILLFAFAAGVELPSIPQDDSPSRVALAPPSSEMESPRLLSTPRVSPRQAAPVPTSPDAAGGDARELNEDPYLRRRLDNLESAQRNFQESIGGGQQEFSAAYALALLCAVIEIDNRGEYSELHGRAFIGDTTSATDVVVSGDRSYRLRREEFPLVIELKQGMAGGLPHPLNAILDSTKKASPSGLSKDQLQQLAQHQAGALETLNMAMKVAVGPTSATRNKKK